MTRLLNAWYSPNHFKQIKTRHIYINEKGIYCLATWIDYCSIETRKYLSLMNDAIFIGLVDVHTFIC
jgi:hypothetical protein